MVSGFRRGIRMISAITAANAAAASINLPRPTGDGRRAAATGPVPALTLGDPRQAALALRKEMASRRMQGVTERMRTLSLMIKADPRSALKLAAELARELKAAVKAYQDAGGRKVSSGDMALIRRQIADARDAQSAAAVKPADAAPPAGEAAPNAEAEVRRAQQAYAAAASAEFQGRSIDRLTEMEAVAVADHGFFDQVKSLVKGLRKARDDIRFESRSALRPPGDEDWKEADKAQVELERQIDTAPAGISVRA